MPLFASPHPDNRDYIDQQEEDHVDGFRFASAHNVKLQKNRVSNFMYSFSNNPSRPVTTVGSYGPSGISKLNMMDDKEKKLPCGKGNKPFLLNGGPYHKWLDFERGPRSVSTQGQKRRKFKSGRSSMVYTRHP